MRGNRGRGGGQRSVEGLGPQWTNYGSGADIIMRGARPWNWAAGNKNPMAVCVCVWVWREREGSESLLESTDFRINYREYSTVTDCLLKKIRYRIFCSELMGWSGGRITRRYLRHSWVSGGSELGGRVCRCSIVWGIYCVVAVISGPLYQEIDASSPFLLKFRDIFAISYLQLLKAISIKSK